MSGQRQRGTDPMDLVEVVNRMLLVLNSRDGLHVDPQLLEERARGIAMAVLGRWDLRDREARAPLLLAIGDEMVVRLDVHGRDAKDLETARFGIYRRESYVPLSTGDVMLLGSDLTGQAATKGRR